MDGVFQPNPNEADGVYGIVKQGSAWIHFQIRRDAVPNRARPPMERDVNLYVTDIAAIHAELTARGAQVIYPLTNTSYGIREFTVEDLNGYRLTYGECL